MRQNPNNRRQQRPRHNGGGHGGGNGGGNHGGGNGGHMGGGNRPRSAASLRHQSFDSNCGDLRVRGNAWQVHEKYQALARDASASGDRVAAENYQQHAEHYFRLIEAIEEATAAEQRQRGGPVQPPQPFGQQPEVPQNYFAPNGGLAQPDAPQPPNGNVQPATDAPQPGGQPPAQAEATVQQRNPAPSPFFTPEEVDEHNGGDHPLKAVR